MRDLGHQATAGDSCAIQVRDAIGVQCAIVLIRLGGDMPLHLQAASSFVLGLSTDQRCNRYSACGDRRRPGTVVFGVILVGQQPAAVIIEMLPSHHFSGDG